MSYLLEPHRVEMKKFGDARAPLTMLKFKMKIMTEKKPGYSLFYTELESMCEEQQKFLEVVEYEVAMAEAVDPVQASSFFTMRHLMNSHT